MVATRGQRIRARLLHRYRAVQERARVQAQRGWLDRPISAMPVIFGEPAVIVRDSFNRNDNAITLGNAETGQPWTAQSGTFGITGRRAYLVTAVSGPADFAVVDAGISDCEVSITLADLGVNQPRLWWRSSAQTDGFWMMATTVGDYRIHDRQAGVNTLLLTIVVAPANGDRIRVRMQGTTFDFYINDVLQGTLTDQTFNQTVTNHGFGFDWTDGRVDDFLVKRLSG